jgi:hypothetical protein
MRNRRVMAYSARSRELDRYRYWRAMVCRLERFEVVEQFELPRGVIGVK